MEGVGDRHQRGRLQIAKTQLSKLLDAALAGEEVVIARAGRPIARLVTVLVDTNALLFALLVPERRSPRASRILRDRAVALVWSVASTWEIVIKARLGKVDLGGDVAAVLARELTALGVQILPIEQGHALAVDRYGVTQIW